MSLPKVALQSSLHHEVRVSKFIVTEKARRRADMRPKCFYCQQPIGQPHEDDCVLISKKVHVRMTVEYEVRVPHHWSVSNILFHRNESSWCMNNAARELMHLVHEAEKNGDCLCFDKGCRFECDNADGEAYLDEG